LRTLEEADTIRSRARQAGRVLVVGGGWIGCEVSASLRALGCDVTLALTGRLPLERTLGPEVATVYARMHTFGGVDLRTGTSIVAFDGADGLRRARTESGQWIDCELAVVAIGVRPRVELAAAAGLRVEDGIVVEGSLATSDPRVFAAGDVALAPSPLLGRSIRVEHWGTALAQGRHAARSMLGGASPYDEIPYVFSDQYDSGMEFWGDPAHPGEFITRGEPAGRDFTAFWCQNGRVSAVLNMHIHHGHGDHDHGDHDHGDHDHHDRPAASMHAGGHIDPADVERLLRSGHTIDMAALRNPAVPLDALTDSGR
jgi:3-phenylpropionate/trans-cinnamate dioxygenase ferredoxin reductase subunit